jgi:hypothetical protein
MNKSINWTKIMLIGVLFFSQQIHAQRRNTSDVTTWQPGEFGSTNWFDASNWSNGVPDSTIDAVIEANPYLIYPIIRNNASVRSIFINDRTSLYVDNVELDIHGEATSAGEFNAEVGTIKFSGSIDQVVGDRLFYRNTIKNLIVNAHVELMGSDTVRGLVTIVPGQTLVTNDNLVLKSDANGSGSIGPIRAISGVPIESQLVGKVTIQRYIKARKAWRLLSIPIEATDAPSINDAWQEGASWSSINPDPNFNALNPKPGYGVHITGGTTYFGYDQSPTNVASMKYYNNATNTFSPISSTLGTYAQITDHKAYMIYIRGNRSINLMEGLNAGITSTILQIKGYPKLGSRTETVAASNFTLLANPYPSAIDFSALRRDNVKNSFYIWDPELTGAFGLGGYVAVSYNPSSGGYDATGASSPIDQFIPSGAAVFVESEDGVNEGSVLFEEEAKTLDVHDQVLRGRNRLAQIVRVNIHGYQADGTTSLIDGALTSFGDNTSNELDRYDVKKMYSGYESVSFFRGGKALAIECRKTIRSNDTCFIQVARLRRMNYKFEIVVENMHNTSLVAMLKDKFDASNNNRVLNMNGINEINFTVTTDPRSYASDRFSIVYTRQVATQNPRFETMTARATSSEEIEVKKPEAMVYPNPVTGNEIQVRMTNVKSGNYEAKVYSTQGQLLTTKRVQYNETDGTFKIKTTRSMVVGKYDLKIEGEGVNIHIPIIRQ